MFKFNNKEYSLDQVESAAAQSNLELNDYLTKTGIQKVSEEDDKEKKKKGVTDKGATVTPVNKDVPKNTDLESEDTSSGSKNIDPVKPVVDKQSKALYAFEKRTGRKATSIMELTDEDFDSNIFEDPFSDNSALVDETKIFRENRDRLSEIDKQRKELENRATMYSYNKFGPTQESVDYVKQQLKTFDEDNAPEIENMEFKPGFKLRNDAINQLSKDTGNYQASGDTDKDLLQELSILNVFKGQGSFKDVEASQEIDLKKDVETAVVDKLDDYQLQKLAGGFYNLQEKESLINEVKIPIVKSRIQDIKKEDEIFTFNITQESDSINENQQRILNSIRSLTGGDVKFKKEDKPTKEQVDEYNVLVGKFNEGLSDLKKLQETYKDKKTKLKDSADFLEGEYGIDLATGALANNFKLSDDIEKFREQYSGDGFWNGTGDILGGEALQGTYQIAKKVTFGFGSWLATVVPDLVESNDTYSSFDAFGDVVSNWSNSTLIPKSEDEKFNITNPEGGFKDFNLRSYLKLAASMLPFTAEIISQVRKGNFKGIKQAAGKTFANLGSKGRVLTPVSQKLKNDIIMANAAFKATIMDNVSAAEKMGLRGVSAQTYGTINSTAEALVQTIMPDSNFLKGAKGKAIKDVFAGSLKKVANKEGAKAASKEYLTNVFKELAEEEITAGVGLMTDVAYGFALPKSSEFLNNQIELVAGTFMLSGSLGASGAKQTFGNQKALVYNQISENINSVDLQLKTMYDTSNDVEVMEEIKKARQFARDVDKAIKSSPENVTADQIDLLMDKQKLIKKRESTDSAFFPAIDKKIEETNNKIQESQVKQDIAKQFETDVKNIDKSIKSTGLKVDETKVFETNEDQGADEQMKEFLLNNAPDNISEKGEDAVEEWANENKDSYGTFVKTKDGKEVLIINKDSALKDSFVTTGQHEFLHKLILSNLGSNNEVVSEAGALLLEDLKSIEDGSELKSRVLSYAEDLSNNEISKEQFFEEVLPLYSEALTRKDVDINRSTLGKAGDFFRQMFQNAGLKKVNFKDAEGVKNFIIDYNKSYSKGNFKGAIKNFSDVSKTESGDQEQKSTADFSKPASVESIEAKLEELEDRYYDGEIDEYQFEQAKDKLDKEIAEAEKAVEVVDQEVETEVKPVEEVEKVDKIVKKATTEVFEAKEVSDKNKQIARTNDDIVKEMTDLGANRISEIKDVEAKKAIVDKLGENNIGAVTELAKKAAATSRDLPIDKNLKVGYEEFFLGFSEELSALINSYKSNVDGKQVPFGAYMNQNLRLRYGSILNRSLKGKLKGSESLSSDKNIKKEVGSFVEESTSESTGRDDGRVLEQIDVRKFGPVKDKTEQISDIVNVEKGQRPTYKELTEEFIDPVSVELFNVPGKKIQGKATLTDAEAKSLQRLFVSPDNVRKLIKTMPPYNVAGSETTIGERAESIDVSKDTKGKSIGLSNKFMKQFYQPVTRAIPGISSPKGRSLGATSQGQVYELKPEFRGRVSNEAVKQIQNSVGVTKAGVPNETISAANRTKYGTTLTGFAKTYIANVINVTGRSKQTDKQEQADTGAGKASIMFSKGSDINENLTKNNKNYTRFRNSVLNKDMFHGGSKTTSTEATWFYLNDPEAAKMWGDGEVYKTNSSLLKDQLIVPDLNDVSEYHKHASKKFGLPEESFYDVREVMKLPNAGEVINDWIDWVTENETDWDLGYNLYENGSLTEGIAVTVIGKIPESKLEPFKEDLGAGESRVTFSKNSALEEGVNPKTLLSTKASKKTLSTKQVNKKSDIMFNDTKALFLNNIGDVDSFLNDTVDYLKNIKLKDKDLQNNIRRVATAPSTRGNLTEYYNWHKLDNDNTLKETLGIKKLIPKKWNSPNDIEAEFNDGTIEGIEVKMNWKDIMGSGGLFFDGKKVKSYTYNNGEPKVSNDIVDGINSNTEVINKLITATENTGNVKSIVKDGKVGMPFTLLSETEGQARSSRKELNRPKFKDISMSIDQVLNHYKKKDVGLFIVGDELFYIQDKRGNFKEMGIPELNTDASIKLRVKTSGIKFRKTNKDFVDSYTLTGQYQFKNKPKNGLKFSKKQKIEKAKNLDKAFNDIIENKTGILSRKRYGIVEATTKGASKGKFNFFIPPSAEDFVGLLYPTLGKGKVGDSQMQWYKDNLISPYAKAMNNLSKARVYILNNYKTLKNQLGVVPKDLSKKVEGTDYTKEMAVRVYIWNKQKMNVPGISKSDVRKLSNFVKENETLQTFGDQLINLQLGDGYIKPKEGWAAGTITTDILEGLNTTKRSKYLKEWQENVDAIFSEDNLNKLQAAYGLNYVKAMKNMLGRMKSGRNRNFPGDSATGRFTDWVTGSVGVTMFLNTRSAVLQTISAINFINFKDNNILAAGKAFANQPQYWKDFMKLMNSDFLKERRGGLRINVSEADIADMAKKGGVKGAISKLLELGFAPTQIADSFAIAAGGSTFYRNRINTYKKQGLSDKQAEKKAFEDFRETAEESQQSSRADRISMQQASPVGRFVLAFANTPAQYARIIKKSASDLKNGRGDAKTHISRIIYYGAAQNLLFNALQQALFATALSDEEPEDEEKEKKYLGIANGMMDSLLRGTGIGGAVISVGKNAVIKLLKELEKDRPKMQNVASEILKISPPVSGKYSRLVQAGKSYDWNKQEMIDKGVSLDNPAYLAGSQVVSALTNIPLDRAIKKAENVAQATSQDLEAWERIALLGGWQDWELGIKEEKEEKPVTKTRSRVSSRRRTTRKPIIK